MISAEQINNMYSNKPQPQNRLAAVTRVINGRPYVRFDGEDTESGKRYAIAAGLTLSVGDRVFMQAVSGTYIIAFKFIA